MWTLQIKEKLHISLKLISNVKYKEFCEGNSFALRHTMIIITYKVSCQWDKHFHQLWHLPDNTSSTKASLLETKAVSMKTLEQRDQWRAVNINTYFALFHCNENKITGAERTKVWGSVQLK